jgi:hypothetical protein
MEKATILRTTSSTGRTLKVVAIGAQAYLEIRDVGVVMNINVPVAELRAALEEEA